jgi:hypothetical protein
MRILEEGLARRGLSVSAWSPLRHDWTRDRAILDALPAARLVIINGEGTLHHGTQHGERLLSVVDHPAAHGVPVALINALWQENPAGWGAWVDKLALVSVRDGRSAAALSRVTRASVRVVPDLTLVECIPVADRRHGIVFGDSVQRSMASLLAQLAQERGDHLVPMLSAFKGTKGRSRFGRWWNARRGAALATAEDGAYPHLALDQDEASHAARVAGAELVVTGRFHGVCFAMAAATPFVALSSNSWKVAALIEDAGLASWRCAAPDDVPSLLAQGVDQLGWTTEEAASLEAFLEHAAARAEALFDDLAAMAR